MHPAIPHLIELQRVDHQMAVLRAELESFPKRLREADTKLSGARAEIASAKDALAKITTERKKFEFAGQEWKDRVRKYRDQSGAVKTNDAYRALQHEISNAEAEIAKAEDRQLEVMMRAEEVERRLRLAESRLKETEESLAAERKTIEASSCFLISPACASMVFLSAARLSSVSFSRDSASLRRKQARSENSWKLRPPSVKKSSRPCRKI